LPCMSHICKVLVTRTAFSHGPAINYCGAGIHSYDSSRVEWICCLHVIHIYTGEAYIYITRVESNECVAFMSHIWKSHVTCTVFSNEPAINYKGASMHSYDLSDCVALLQFFSMGDTHFFLHFT